MPSEKQEPQGEPQSASLGNVAPDRPALWDPEEMDVFEGTTSGTRLRGKPPKGSRGHNGI